VILLEEPLAAFYAWTAQAGKEWRAQIRQATSSWSATSAAGRRLQLIAISANEGVLDLNRISVGEHILLGGDNMDLALAYTLRTKLEADGKSIGEMQFLALTHAAGNAKVAMFEKRSYGRVPNCRAVARVEPARRNRLDETRPANARTGHPRRLLRQDRDRGTAAEGAAGGLAGIRAALRDRSRHQQTSRPLLTRSLENVQASETLRSLVGAEARSKPFLAPTAVLFNGGVFKAAPIRRHLLDLLAAWNQGQSVRELAGYQPDLAVAKGASFFGRNRITGKGIRIKAGASRSYYIGLETSMPAVPGFNPPLKACASFHRGWRKAPRS